ncbi:MAG: hypothetical protein CMH49_10280 [Myxococcales bacterium]|nr:hypothetical protein [Myxococcales bacterium]
MQTHHFQALAISKQQNQHLRLVLFLGATLACLLLTTSVSAKPFTIHSSSLNFKPKAWLSADYDDNVFYEADLEPTGNVPNQGAVLKVGGGLTIENRGKSPVGLDVDALSAYRHYTFLDGQAGQSESTVDKLRQGRNGIDFARFNGKLTLGALSDVQVILQDHFNYIERPAYEGTVFGFERVDNRLGAAVDFAPGRRNGGGPLGINLGYEMRTIFFLNDGEGLDIQSRSEKQAHTLSLDTRWRFLPKNFLTLNLSYSSNNYNDFEQDLDAMNPELSSRDSTPLRAQLGLSGLITPRFSLFLRGGYANTYNKNGNSFKGFIGLFQASYKFAPILDISIGYQRDGQDSGFSNFYILDRIFAKSTFKLSSRLQLTGNVSYDTYTYDASNAIDDTGRVDPVLRSQIALRTQLPSHLAVQIAYSIESNYTEYKLPINEPVDFAAYQRQLFTLALFFN